MSADVARLARRAPALTAPPAGPATGDAPLRGEGILRALESPVLRLEALVGRSLPQGMNPLARTGACSVALLLIATATGILLLPFYDASPARAHASVEAMMAAPLTLGLLRSLHRYSSDGAVLFAVLHVVRLLLARRVGGTRALAWITGSVMLGLTVLVGWLGYWLVWDDAGALVAQQTARALDGLGLFAEPIERSFLVDADLSATTFFVAFFAHMLLPLAMGVLLWLHVMRLPRVRLLPGRALAVALGLVLIAMSLLVPAPVGEAASMAVLPASVRIDAWYLAPLFMVRWGALPALAVTVGALVVLGALAGILPRRRLARVAEVIPASCNACAQCVTDCPHDAIRLVPRGERPGRAELLAHVDPARCVGCGLCSASCEPGAIGLPWMGSLAERSVVDAWVSEDAAGGAPPVVAWICEEIAAPSLRPDRGTGRVAGIPGVRAVVVPCAGFVHSLTIERAARRGAAAILVLSCPEGSCRHREGAEQLRERLSGRREPALRVDRIGAVPVLLREAGHVDARRLAREADRARRAAGVVLPAAPRRAGMAATGAILAVLLALPTLALTDVELPLARPEGGRLVVSFRQPGQIAEICRDLSPEEIAALPPHMRRTRDCARERMPVRLRVSIDDRIVHESSHAGAGLWSDGESVALIELEPAAGRRRVRVEIADGPEAEGFRLIDERVLEFEKGRRHVVLFDRNRDFTWT